MLIPSLIIDRGDADPLHRLACNSGTELVRSAARLHISLLGIDISVPQLFQIFQIPASFAAKTHTTKEAKSPEK